MSDLLNIVHLGIRLSLIQNLSKHDRQIFLNLSSDQMGLLRFIR